MYISSTEITHGVALFSGSTWRPSEPPPPRTATAATWHVDISSHRKLQLHAAPTTAITAPRAESKSATIPWILSATHTAGANAPTALWATTSAPRAAITAPWGRDNRAKEQWQSFLPLSCRSYRAANCSSSSGYLQKAAATAPSTPPAAHAEMGTTPPVPRADTTCTASTVHQPHRPTVKPLHSLRKPRLCHAPNRSTGSIRLYSGRAPDVIWPANKLPVRDHREHSS